MYKLKICLTGLCSMVALFAKAQVAGDSTGYIQSFDSTKIYYEVRKVSRDHGSVMRTEEFGRAVVKFLDSRRE